MKWCWKDFNHMVKKNHQTYRTFLWMTKKTLDNYSIKDHLLYIIETLFGVTFHIFEVWIWYLNIKNCAVLVFFFFVFFATTYVSVFLGIKVVSLCILFFSNTNPKHLGMNERTDHAVQKRVCSKARRIQLRFSRSPAEGRSSSFKNLCTSKSLSSRFKLRNFSTTNWHLLPTNRNISHTAFNCVSLCAA